MIEINGKSGIVARMICDSISTKGNRLSTFEIEVPRIVWAEFLTHGMLCRNAASSRAIPFKKMQDQLTGIPVRFGKANKGMMDDGEHTNLIHGIYTPEEWWEMAKLSAVGFSKGYYDAGYSKQVFNRTTETYQQIKAVVSMTEFDNFNWLRNHGAADPTIAELARCMLEAREQSVPQLLKAGEWHLPYIDTLRYEHGLAYYIGTASGGVQELTLDEAIRVSCARTAAVSFRNEDYGLAKCLEVYATLVDGDHKHASALQHQATPMQREADISTYEDFSVRDVCRSVNVPEDSYTWEHGVSHADREGNLWSAQYKGWIMFRKTVDGENYIG